MKPKIRDGIKIRKEDWGAILADTWLGGVYELNDDGSRILSLCDGEKAVEDIIRIFAEEYGLPTKKVESVVEDYLHFLQKRKVIVYGSVSPKGLSGARFRGISHKIVQYHGETLKVVSGFERYRERPLDAPLSATLEVTSKCNLRCKHCYANAGDSYGKELETDEILKFIDELAEMKVFQIAISGGEPMTHKDIFKIIDRCIQNGISTLLSTNGTLITHEKACKLKQTGLKSVQVSIDGINAKAHDDLRGVSGAHRRAVRGLENLIHVEIDIVGVATVASKLNFEEIPRLVDQLDGMGVSYHRILRFLPLGRGRTRRGLELTNEEIKELLGNLKRKDGEPGKIVVDFSDAFNPPIVDRPTHACTGGVLWCVVNPYGYVVPCTYLSSPEVAHELRAESIANRSFKSIWQNCQLFANLRNANLLLKGKCSDCEYRSTCGGGCRAAAYAHSKDILAPDPHCSYEPRAKAAPRN